SRSAASTATTPPGCGTGIGGRSPAHRSPRPGRFAAAAAFDPLTGVVMLYGGRLGPGQVVDDTWAWDGRTWRQLDGGTGTPPLGEGSVMAWDDVAGQMVLVSNQPAPYGGTWAWNGSRWMRQAHGDLPSGTSQNP